MMAQKTLRTTATTTSLELFTGAGGLALGLATAGFHHLALAEFNRDACESIRKNFGHFTGKQRPKEPVLFEGDVKDVDFAEFSGRVDVLAAGAPCQPFSIGGKHLGHKDERNLFPEVFRVMREVNPRAIIIENVKGLLRPSLSPFVEYISLQLSMPEVLPRNPMDASGWQSHLSVLKRAAKRSSNIRYQVRHFLLQAADFGVPQKRERAFFVALRNDLGAIPAPPAPTHSEAALWESKFVTREYWQRHGIRQTQRMPETRRRFSQLELGSQLKHNLLPWKTVRDALMGLPEPKARKDSEGWLNHTGQPGARVYPGHTGSHLDEPAKTVKAGVHGVPGGENMLRRPNGTVRYFTVRETARIQTFPDTYAFSGAWGAAMKQLGNAVPVELAAAVAREVRRYVIA